MKDPNTRKINADSDDLCAFRLSADHLEELIRFYRSAPDERLLKAIDRAVAAHIAIAKQLSKDSGTEPSDLVENQPNKAALPKAPKDENWLGSPWEYLKIPSPKSNRLGPMPRFVPLPQKGDDRGSDS